MKRSLSALAAGAAVALFVACGQDHIIHAGETVQVVGGTPTVGQGLPGVDRLDGGLDASFGPAAPFQVDSFAQQQVQKVDILWVVDNSRSMLAKQQRLAANLHSFMQFLTGTQLDYHLGVVSTDTFDPLQSGHLQNKAGLAQPWITSAAGGNAEAYFVQNVGLGELGSGDEKGLLGAMMALTPPLSPGPVSGGSGSFANCVRNPSTGQQDCFIRSDAALYTVIISDEEDSSCSPIRNSGNAVSEGCDESSIHAGGYGGVDYWSRFFAGVKGLNGVSRVAAITATDTSAHDCATEFAHFCDQTVNAKCAGSNIDCNNVSNLGSACCQAIYGTCSNDVFYKAQWCHVRPTQNTAPPYYEIYGSWQGCSSVSPADGGIEFTAFTGQRYATVAQSTGGVAASICDQDYTPALKKLGLQASGLRADFPLSRAPISTSIAVLVRPPGGAPQLVPPGANTWQYVSCDQGAAVNVIRFTDASRPVAGATLQVSYDVNVRGVGACP